MLMACSEHSWRSFEQLVGHGHEVKACRDHRSPRYDNRKIGKLNDGSNVYSFVYKGDPNQRQQIGLMAQEVRKRTPEAVHKLPSGHLAVDYGLALERAIGARQ